MKGLYVAIIMLLTAIIVCSVFCIFEPAPSNEETIFIRAREFYSDQLEPAESPSRDILKHRI